MALSYLVWKIPNVSMHCLIRNSNTLISLALDLLRLLSTIAWFSPTNSWSFFLLEQSEVLGLPYLHNHHWTLLTVFDSSDWCPHSLKSWYWCIWCECHLVEHTVSNFLEKWIASWCCFPHRQCPTHTCLLQSRQNLLKKKKSACENFFFFYLQQICYHFWKK